VDAFAALADPVRRGLLEDLADSPARVVDLAAVRPISRPAVSRHLRVLGEAGLVVVDVVGRERHYRLRRAGLDAVTSWVAALTTVDGARGRISSAQLDGLDLEVRRTARDRRGADDRTTEETA